MNIRDRIIADAAVPGLPNDPLSIVRHFLKDTGCSGPILVALSGGSDSTGLLIALREALGDRASDVLVAATVDHGLRAGSAEEAQAVAYLCRSLCIAHHIVSWRGEKPGTGLQAAARNARYRLLSDLAGKIHARFIVTGHTADDQRETIVMRAARSDTGSLGLSGMAPAVLLNGRHWTMRPFLTLTRQAIRDYLKIRDIAWHDDPGNSNPHFERVRVRQGLSGLTELAEDNGRRAIAQDAADFLTSAFDMPQPDIARIDLAMLEPENPAHRLGLLTVIAFTGGRSHRLGRASTAGLMAFLKRGAPGRMTAGSTVVDRRGAALYIYRENRGLPQLKLAPGQTGIWDGRYLIGNHGRDGIVIGPEPDGVTMVGSATVPAGVLKRAHPAIPRLYGAIDGQWEVLEMHRLVRPYDQFLPGFDLPLANALARAAGIEPFGDPPEADPAELPKL